MDQATQKRIDFWLEKSFDDATKEEIRRLQKSDQEALVDAFYTTLSFGTGGMRGLMGPGTNRMNVYTVRWATQGLANYLKKVGSGKSDLSCAIGYDSRHNSKLFAEEAARVLAGNGIKVFLFSEIRPTPLVSFACRYHTCSAAIMVTASHNPPQYNGYKVYWDDGAQVLPPHDVGIIKEVEALNDPDQVRLAPVTSPMIERMGKEVDDAYLAAITPLQLWPDATDGASLSILYSSLHGTGITMVPQALQRFGFTNVQFVDKQVIPDGDFPTCKKPNPEERQALSLGIKKMLEEECDIFIATDPDCDRLGVVVLHDGKDVAFNGNQILSLAAEYVCKAFSPMPKKPAFVKTIVTTELFRHIVEAHNGTCFDVLTGFKYIAEKIRTWEASSAYSYVFGGEESYGCLLGTVVRDKDAVIASCLLAEIALYAKRQNKTLVDLLNDIYTRYGVFVEHLISLDYEETKEGKDAMQKTMQRFRQNCPTKILDISVVKCTDLLTATDLPKADVLILELDDKSRIVIRPSGTEPRIKIYILTHEKPDLIQSIGLEKVKEKAEGKAKALAAEFATNEAHG